MNNEEIQELIKQLKDHFKNKHPDKSDKEIDNIILDIFFKSFCNDKMSREDLTTLTLALGYEVNDDVLDEVEEDKKIRNSKKSK